MYVDLTIAVDGIKSLQKMVIGRNDAPMPTGRSSELTLLANLPSTIQTTILMTILPDSKCRPVVDISEMIG